MGFRFRRSLRLAPGVRLNFGLRSASLSLGPRGASVNVGSRGVFGNIGLPGTGLSYRQRLSAPARVEEWGELELEAPSYEPTLDDRGRLILVSSDGALLPPGMDRRIRRAEEAQLRDWLAGQCDIINAQADEILLLHLATPAPSLEHRYRKEAFAVPAPTPPAPLRLGWLDRLIPARRRAKAAAYDAALAHFDVQRGAWSAQRLAHDRTQEELRVRWEEGRLHDEEVMEELLANALSAVPWPRETVISFDVDGDGRLAYLDVDLPELEDMPDREAEIAARGLKLNIRIRSEASRRRMYAAHIHAVLFRLVGESFATLPKLEIVECSGYSQRRDSWSGQECDEYLLSVRVERSAWSELKFDDLRAIDPVDALSQFSLARRMSKAMSFEPIVPLALAEKANREESPGHIA